MLGIIVILLVIIASIGYFYWSQQMIQLTPDDIEIVSIEKNKVSKKNIYNSERNRVLIYKLFTFTTAAASDRIVPTKQFR